MNMSIYEYVSTSTYLSIYDVSLGYDKRERDSMYKNPTSHINGRGRDAIPSPIIAVLIWISTHMIIFLVCWYHMYYLLKYEYLSRFIGRVPYRVHSSNAPRRKCGIPARIARHVREIKQLLRTDRKQYRTVFSCVRCLSGVSLRVI